MISIFIKIRNFILVNIALVGIVAAAVLLRLWNLTSISLWHDEAFSALLIKYPWSEMMHRIGLDVHPPMYYIFLRLWSYIFGNSLFSLRGMSVLFGVGSVIISYYFVLYAFKNRKAALLTALFIAVNPFQVQYVTEARMYTMGAFFAIAAGFSLMAALRTQTAYFATKTNLVLKAKLKKKLLWYYAAFIITGAIIIYTHYYLLFTAAALGLYALIYCAIHFRLQIKKWGMVILSGILIAALYVPWLKTFLFQLNQVGSGYWIPPMNRWSIPDTLWQLLLRLPYHQNWVLAVITLLILVIVIRVLWKQVETEKWLTLGGLIAPFGGAILFFALAQLQHNNNSVYLVRYFIFSSAFFSMFIALWLSKFRIRQVANMLAIVLVAVNLFSVWKYWSDLQVQTKPGMNAASKYLNANVEPQHKIYVGSSFEFFNYKYYNHTGVKPLLFTDGHLTHDLPHFAGTAILTDDDLVLNFADATRHGDTVWLMWTNGFGGSKPNVPNNWTQVDEKGFAEVRPYVGTWIIVTEYKVN